MPKSLPFFKFDADAWLTGKTQLLSAQEKGTLIDLLCRIWKEENGVIANDEFLHRLLRVDKATLSNALATLSDLKIVCEKDGVLSVNFLSEQLAERKEYLEKMSAFGKKGGRPKKGTKPKNKHKQNILNSSDTSVSSEFSLEQENPCSPGNAKRKIFFDYEGDGKIHGIDEETLAYWAEMYPALNLSEELNMATSWLDANRKARKHDVKKFLVNWLNRAQARARVQKTEPERDYTGL